MAKVNICNVEVKNNPSMFKEKFQFEITFDCIENLSEDLEWKLIYVGSAESEEYDQTLDSVVVGPVVAGRHMFVFEADSPDVSKLPRDDIVGVTVILLTCSYENREFVRVGYYVNNEYVDPELKETPPPEPDFDKLQRNILATCPRVTRFKIDWGDEVESFGGEASGGVVREDSMDVAASLKADMQSHSSLSFPPTSTHESNGNGHSSNGATDYATAAHAVCEPMQI